MGYTVLSGHSVKRHRTDNMEIEGVCIPHKLLDGMLWREDAVRDTNRLVGKLEKRRKAMAMQLEAKEKENQLLRQQYTEAADKLELITTPKYFFTLYYMALGCASIQGRNYISVEDLRFAMKLI